MATQETYANNEDAGDRLPTSDIYSSPTTWT